jgi:hypothetical protein
VGKFICGYAKEMNFKPIKEISFPKGQSTSRNLNIGTKEN